VCARLSRLRLLEDSLLSDPSPSGTQSRSATDFNGVAGLNSALNAAADAAPKLLSHVTFRGQLPSRYLLSEGQRRECEQQHAGANDAHCEEGPAEVPELVIGVVSARHHFEQRRAIRETWGSPEAFARHGTPHSVVLRFILGEFSCDVSPARRLSPHGCDRRESEKFAFGKQLWAHDAPATAAGDVAATDALASAGVRVVGTDFVANHWVTLTHLGVFVGDAKISTDSSSNNSGGGDDVGIASAVSFTVALWDTTSEVLLFNLSVDLSSSDGTPPGAELVGSIMYVPLPPNTVLPKGFAGTVVATGHVGAVRGKSVTRAPLLPRDRTIASDGGGLVTLLNGARVGTDAASFPRQRDDGVASSLLAASFGFRVDVARSGTCVCVCVCMCVCVCVCVWVGVCGCVWVCVGVCRANITRAYHQHSHS
jgi:hypothetical protein